jgi:hypothetical protein
MDDELDQRLSAAATDVARVVHLTTPERVRARGDRRRVGVTAAAAAVLVAVVAVGIGVVSANAGDGGEVAGRRVQGRQISDLLKMPHEDEPGWTRNDDPDVRPAFDGCQADDPTLAGRTDARTVTGPNGPTEREHSPATMTEQLFLYEDETRAKSVLAALSERLTPCGWTNDAPDMTNAPSRVRYAGPELSGSIHHSAYPKLDIEKVSGYQFGSAVFIVHVRIGGAGMTSSGINEEPVMARDLCRVMAICKKDSDGRVSPPPETGSATPPGPSATGK